MLLSRLANLLSGRKTAAPAKRAPRTRLRFEPLEGRRLLTMTPLSYTSGGGQLTIDISSDHLSYEIRNSSNTVVAQQLVANTSEIDISGSLSKANSLVLNFGNATAAPTSVSYNGQGSTQGSIYIANSSTPSLTIDYALFDSTTDAIYDNIATATRYFSFTDNGSSAESISLAAGSSSGTLSLESTNAVAVNFVDPTTSLTLSEDGSQADTIAIESLDSAFAASLSVIGIDDTIDVEPSSFPGSLVLNAGGMSGSQIDLESSTLSIGGKATFAAEAIHVVPSTITSTGDQVYSGPVTLASSSITMSATSSHITFDGTVDGSTNLTVDAALATFYEAVGSQTELHSLTVNAGEIDLESTVTAASTPTYSEPTPAKLSGSVYVDANDNGTFDSGETPLSGVTVTLTGTNDLLQTINTSTTTAADGSYSFTGLRPGTYTLTETQPSGDLPGTSSVGLQGGVLGSGLITSISLATGIAGTGNNFAELLPASLSGYVYLDANDNGVFNSGESAVSGAAVTLTGTNDQGTAINVTTHSTAAGAFSFSNLRPGTYKLTEARPSGDTDGVVSVGTQGGTASATRSRQSP